MTAAKDLYRSELQWNVILGLIILGQYWGYIKAILWILWGYVGWGGAQALWFRARWLGNECRPGTNPRQYLWTKLPTETCVLQAIRF